MKLQSILSVLRRRTDSQAGAILVDAVVAIAALGVLGAGIAGAVQAGLVAQRRFEVQSISENLLRNQLQYVFEQPYAPPPTTYQSIAPPPGYSVTAEALPYDLTSANIQTVRITVLVAGRQFRVFETMRADW